MKCRFAAILFAALAAAAPAAAQPAPEPAPRSEVTPVPLERPAADMPEGARVIPLEVAPLETPEAALGAGDVDGGDVVKIPLNKTRPLDLPGEARDVVVGNPAIADVIVRAPDQVYLTGKAVGSTNIFFVDARGSLLRRLEVNVHLDVESLRQALRELVPNAGVTVAAVNDTLFLSGTVRTEGMAANARAVARRFVAEDANIVNMMRVTGEQQVLLKVRVAEVQKTVLKEFGFRTSYGPKGIGGSLVNFTGRIGDRPLTAFSTAAFAYNAFSTNVGVLEQQGLVKTLAEPTLTAVSGEKASLLAGGEFPVATSAENNRVVFEFKPFGVGLSFVPVVLDSGRISLQLATEVSDLSDAGAIETGGISIQALTVRRASTTVELPSGGGLMIAGLLRNDASNNLQGVPGLKDLPILGALFRSTSFQQDESELVVTVSAYVVQPVDANAIAVPSDGFVPASDLDLYLLGRLHEVYDRPMRAVEGQALPLKGPVGYIVE